MYLLSYIRGDFVYCPVLLVLFSVQYQGAYPTNCAFFTFVYFVFKKFLGAAFIYTDG